MKRLLIALMALSLVSCGEPGPRPTLSCEIISHHVTSSESGNAHYHSVVHCVDGVYRSIQGLSIYNMPVGSSANFYTDTYDFMYGNR